MPMILHEPYQPTAPSSTMRTAASQGIPGDPDSAVALYDACVRVGKLDRAAAVLNRLKLYDAVPPEQLMYMHNKYFNACIEQLKMKPDGQFGDSLHKWYELHVRGLNLPQTTETIAYMLKITLLTVPASEGARLTRLITRYMNMVPSDQGLDVLYCTDILADADIAVVTKHFPEFNIPDVPDFDADAAAVEAQDEDIRMVTDESKVATEDGSSVPHVLPTPQKGVGLETVKRTVDIFTKFKDGDDISRLPPVERREFQSRLERDCIDAAVERWRKTDEDLRAMGLNTSLSAGNMSARLWAWHQDLEALLKQEFDEIAKAEEKKTSKSEIDNDRRVYGPILLQSTPSRLAATTILATLGMMTNEGGSRGVAVSTVISAVAKTTEEDIHSIHREAERKATIRQAKAEWLRKKQNRNDEPTKPQEPPTTDDSTPKLASPEDEAKYQTRTWPVIVRAKVGATLLSALSKVAKVRVVREHPATGTEVISMQPAFSHTMQYKKGRKVGTIIAHPSLAESMRVEPKADFLARHLPMVVKPDSWTKFDKGAYLESRVPLIRMKSGEMDQRLYAEAAFKKGDMEQVAKGLDVLGKTAWRINRPVFDVFLEVWNSGEQFAKIPPLNPDIPAPEEPEATADPLVRQKWTKSLKQAHNLRMSLHSQRCYMNFQLEIARSYRDQEFFFPHNVDFRGRAYPIPPYLNHMGADHVRGLLRFSKGRELGERGLMWLKVHLANVYGFDKASLLGREAFAMEHLSDIYDSANNPLKGARWWLQAEDPWQCLAACFELVAALESPEPTKYVSSLPIHQDGTCNGLQHYAALGGDSWGARQVNLAPSDKPADVYTAVADLVNEAINTDAREGNKVALAVQGKVKRKVVKQTVMTNVYGVTFAGAKKQVLRQIDALYPKFEQETGLDATMCSSYLALKIFSALSTMFKGAHDIQHWLGEIGGRVCRALTVEQLDQIAAAHATPESILGKPKSKSKAKSAVTKQDLLDLCRSTIIWTTPLRMPVVQPYRKNSQKLVATCMQTLVLSNPHRSDPVHRRKQLQAFPPNFIHSLDASHMLLSALECNDLGLTFAAVHDSFWTHAADVDVMNRVLREAFIRIHSEDVIKRLLAEFEARYHGGLYLAMIDRDSPAGKAVLRHRSSNRSISAAQEVLVERERVNLLRSENPADREKGQKMVTPASIYAQFASESGEDIVAEDTSAVGLGSLVDQPKEIAMDDVAAEPDEAAIPIDDPEAVLGEGDVAGQLADDDESGRGNSKFFTAYAEGSKFECKFGTAAKARPKSPQAKKKTPIPVWLPLSFPAVPQKGDFKVDELRNSDYFFS